MTSFRAIAPWLMVAVVLLSARWGWADTKIVYRATELSSGGESRSVLLPTAVEISSSAPAELARGVLGALRSGRPSLYEGAKVALADGAVTLEVGDAALRARDIVISEVYHSFRSVGFDDVRIPAVQEAPLAEGDAVLPSYRPVYELWQVLPPRQVGAALVRTGPDTFGSVESAQRKLLAGDEGLTDDLRGVLRTGPAKAKLAVIAFFEAQSAPGRASHYILQLTPGQSVEVKLALLQALQGSKNKRVLDAIAALADADDDARVKSTAARTLMEAGREKYRTYILLEKLNSESVDEVLAAMRQLMESGDARVAGTVAGMLSHNDERVQRAALEGLGALGGHGLLAKALDDEKLPPELRLRIAGELPKSGDGAATTRALRYQLARAPAEQAAAAAAQLGERKSSDALDDLVAALRHDSGDVRQAAARALGELKAQRALPALAEAAEVEGDREVVAAEIIRIVSSMPLDKVIALTESDVTVLRQLAIKSLAEFAKDRDRVPGRILAVLKARLKDPATEIRRAAAYALARTRDPEVVEGLMALEGDSDEMIREQVVVAVAAVEVPGRKDFLVKKMRDPSDKVKLPAIVAVRELGIRDGLGTLLNMVDYGRIEVKREVMRAVVKLAQPSDHGHLFDLYVRMLFDMDQDVKLAAVAGISVIQDPRVVSQVGSLVRDPSEEVQIAALCALGTTGDARAVEPVAGALMSGSKAVKMAAIDAIGELRVEQAAKPIQEFLRNETDEELRARAESVLDLLP